MLTSRDIPASQMPANHDEIKKSLDCLLNDAAFQASARNRRFLRFIVEQTLAGQAHRIKSYVIAVDVFGRPPAFDGAADPIVRIEASRLRSALSNYYANSACNARLEIFLPKGGYIPSFRWLPQANGSNSDQRAVRQADAVHVPEPTQWALEPTPIGEAEIVPRGAATAAHCPSEATALKDASLRPTILSRLARMILGPRFGLRKTMRPPILFVDQIEALTDDGPTRLLARTLGQSLISALGQYDGVVISRKPFGGDEAVLKLVNDSPARLIYRFSAEVRIDQNTVRLWWKLSNVRSMEICRSASEEGSWHSPSSLPVESDIAEKVAAAIVHRNGLLVR